MINHIARSLATALAIIAVVGAFTGNAFTASVPDRSGQGTSAISGYAVSNVGYELGDGDATTIESVSFTIDPTTAQRVRIRLVSSGGTWYECTNVSGRVSCPTFSPAVLLAAADELAVQATGS